MRNVLIVLFVLGLSFVSAACAQEAKPLTNEQVVQMVKAGLSEEMILKTIQANAAQFDTAPQSLAALKEAGVSEKVLAAMLAASHPVGPSKSAPVSQPGLPDDVGVYYIRNESLVEIHPEIVGWRSGGAAKSVFIGTKGHINGVVKGPHSAMKAATPLEFYIRCPETLDIAEYLLLRLDEKPDRREFRALTGGFIHSSSGTDQNAVPFKFTKVAPRIYKITLEGLKPGEYGFLPPGGTFGAMGGGTSGAPVMQGSANAGKIYTFHVIE